VRSSIRAQSDVKCEVALGIRSVRDGAVPSGASTASTKRWNWRDGDPKRYLGKGVLKAVANVTKMLAPRWWVATPLIRRVWNEAMIKADGTPNKARPAPMPSGRVMAAARAAAAEAGLPLYRYLGGPARAVLAVRS